MLDNAKDLNSSNNILMIQFSKKVINLTKPSVPEIKVGSRITQKAEPAQFESHLDPYTDFYEFKEDISLETQSQYEKFGDMFAILGKIRDLNNLMSQASGKTNALNDLFNYNLWKSTEPLKLNTTLTLFKDDSYYRKFRVQHPQATPPSIRNRVLRLISQVMISYDSDKGVYYTPGLSLTTFKQLSSPDNPRTAPGGENGIKSTDSSDKAPDQDKVLDDVFNDNTSSSSNISSKWVTMLIPGIVGIKYAMITSAKPKYSRKVDSSGDPLWAEVDLSIESITPARDNFFGDMINVPIAETLIG